MPGLDGSGEPSYEVLSGSMKQFNYGNFLPPSFSFQIGCLNWGTEIVDG
jgi:hypothetical protein